VERTQLSEAASGHDTMNEIPIACSLTSTELDQRREVLTALRARCTGVEPVENGLRLLFEAAPGVLADIARVIDLERQCCRFLRFQLEVLPDGGPIALELTGPEGTADFLGAELGFSAP
jgi:hypothetical protein